MSTQTFFQRITQLLRNNLTFMQQIYHQSFMQNTTLSPMTRHLPGGPTKRIIFPLTPPVKFPTAMNSNILSFNSLKIFMEEPPKY